jgi:RimJ/RimL family protein N-acetyltransferase
MPDPITVQVQSRFETDRLILRSFEAADATALHEALLESIEQLRRHLWFLPWVAQEQTLAAAEARCRAAQANFLLRTDLPYLAFKKDSGRLVGSVGLHRTDWNEPKTEVGYWIRSSETGNGYASEGVQALANWALSDLRAIRVELVTLEENAASRAVAARCGFALEGVHRNVMRGLDGNLRHRYVFARLPSAARLVVQPERHLSAKQP